MRNEFPPIKEDAPLPRPKIGRFTLPLFVAQLAQLLKEVPSVQLFAIATFTPLGLLALGAVFGGIFPWIALFYITVFTALLDWSIGKAFPDAPEDAEFPTADALSTQLAWGHFAALLLAIYALSGGTDIGPVAKVGVFLGFGLFFGQVSNANAHELIHRGDKRLFSLGMWVYISLLFGHHTSAHRHVHHRFVATPDDPNTAQLGENFYAFFARSWIGSFIAGYEMEEARRRGKKGLRRINPYYLYVLGGFAWIAGIGVLMGLGGILAYLAIVFYAQIQLILSDYVQHYGLERKKIGLDSYETVDARHSWDARAPISSLWMMNAPRHSDHHAHPAREYPALVLGEIRSDRPMLPRSLPSMAAIAMIPPLWRRMMDRRVLALRSVQTTVA
jgi:alkane 1-monooxygenase